MTPLHIDFTSITGIIAFVAASATEVVSVKYLNYSHNWNLPFLTALIMSSFSIPLGPHWAVSFVRTEKTEFPQQLSTRKRLLAYGVLGLIAYFATICRGISLNYVPGSIFSLMMASSVLFTTALSRLVLRQKQHFLQYSAALIVAGAVALIATSKGSISERGPTVSHVEYVLGLSAGLGSGLCAALMSVSTAKLLHGQTGSQQRVYDVVITGGLFSLLLVLPTAAIAGEMSSWVPLTAEAVGSNHVGQFLFWGSWIVLAVGKVFIRGGKYTVIAAHSAFFFAFIDGLRTVATSLMPVLVFHEPFTIQHGVALVLIVAAFILNGYGKQCHERIKGIQARKTAVGHQQALLQGGLASPEEEPYASHAFADWTSPAESNAWATEDLGLGMESHSSGGSPHTPYVSLELTSPVATAVVDALNSPMVADVGVEGGINQWQGTSLNDL